MLEEDHYYPFGLTLSSGSGNAGEKNDYKLTTKELQNQFGLNWYDFGARMYDEQIGRWNGVDPKAQEFFSHSPYEAMDNNPINVIDPTGESGELIIDKKSKIITVYSNIILYGGGANKTLANNVAKDIESKWNEANGKVTINNVEYSVKFSVTGSYDNKIKEKDISKNTDIKNNYIRVEETVNGNISYMDDAGANTGYYKLDNIKAEGSTTEAHEFGHGYGLEHPVDLDYRGQGQPGIMYPRGTLVDPSYQYDPSALSGMPGGTLNPEKRKVTQQDITNLGLDKIRFNKSGRGKLGKLTNKYHDKTK